ncbi:universal stress protein [Dyella sp.]|uniref:universal stress protein n=1 Tax=Dyella sp. TaxID=1869338 RepID=UPI002ED14687
MFKHILLPTDGSELSLRAVALGAKVAAACQSRVTVLHVVLPLHVHAYLADMLASADIDYTIEAERQAQTYLDAAARVVAQAGGGCQRLALCRERVAQGILDVAMEHACDLIVMGSHGRQGIQRLLLGSATHDVIVQGDIPVLVCR